MRLRESLCASVAGRDFVLMGAPMPTIERDARLLEALGARQVLRIGSRASFEPAPADRLHVYVDDVLAHDPRERFSRWEAFLAEPTREVRDAVDRFDPAGTAQLVAFRPLVVDHFGDRELPGARRPSWARFERKTQALALFDATRTPHPPMTVLDVRDVPKSQFREISYARAFKGRNGSGAVWSADPLDGPASGARFVRRARNNEEISSAYQYFSMSAGSVLVTPFVEGIPCSMHGFVTKAGTAAFRSIESVVLRRGPRFSYAGAASRWQAPPDVQSTMQECAKRVGEWLHENLGYRGGFTLDGILGESGFVANEVNTRPGDAARYFYEAVPGIPFETLTVLEAADAVDLDVDELERAILDAPPYEFARLHLRVREEPGPVSEHAVRVDAAGAEVVPPAHANAHVRHEPWAGGGRIVMEFDRKLVAPGHSVASVVRDLAQVANDRFGLDLGQLEAARDVSRVCARQLTYVR